MDPRIIALIAIVIGLALCFAGYKIQKLVVTIAWFAIGFTIAGQICSNFVESNNILLIIQIVVGFIVGSLGFKLEKLALAIAVAYLTYNAIGPYIPAMENNMTMIVQIGASLVVGILSTLFIRPILICVTSVAGAALIRDNISTLVTLQPNVITIGFIVIAVLGILSQLKTT